MKYPQHLLKVIDVLKRLPGVGNKSAERFAFQMLNWPSEHIKEMASVLNAMPDQLKACATCGCISGDEGCDFCTESRVQSKVLCVIGSARDAFSIDETGEYRGLYHVLGGLLSPLDGFGPEKLQLAKLVKRIERFQIQEVVIALDSTIEGDATALYLKQELSLLNVAISRLAFGLPMGSSLDYVDGGTLARALSGRSRY